MSEAKWINGVLQSKNENRYKYFIHNFSSGIMTFEWTMPVEFHDANNIDSGQSVKAIWLGKEFFQAFQEANPEYDFSTVQRYRKHAFYREILTTHIKNGTKLVVMPNLDGLGCAVESKKLKIDIFKEVWEREQEEWIFKLH